ncbi:SDR family NAD(P)-dependent oxidoreductase [Paeniglutamicibacter cryotolerans]|uniref:NAD(P)-dependent dehydrogenase (Short-subunit alcohol dehydrogenase family) n=1 Tax=Paeniglutamicibacter cryotolerans TaxID=670079 RepID=A0A839QRF4_9MICC|nr:SDR family NAD(P)-dependent oxidoreductase [Paeniglutamicibacter cryotolerans]MBB2994651.1 NAD(P)-dependent dehydrogenase (short-subunit alcohol dehydrogenase family) [Paeniglutamicibacter cryotolerans]
MGRSSNRPEPLEHIIIDSKTIVITGASNGIGAAAARKLSALGHQVVLVGRNRERTAALASELKSGYFLADFSDLAEVRELAANLRAAHPRIDILANNAGGIFTDVRQESHDGHELTFQVNYLSPFLLTSLLLDRLVASHGTVVNTSSVASRLYGHLDLENLESRGSYTAARAYGTAKLAQILFTGELQRQYGPAGLNAAAFHPGIVSSGFSAGPGDAMRGVYQNRWIKPFLTRPEKGADTLVFLATTPAGTGWKPGSYFVRRKLSKVPGQASDTALSTALWERSKALLALD